MVHLGGLQGFDAGEYLRVLASLQLHFGDASQRKAVESAADECQFNSRSRSEHHSFSLFTLHFSLFTIHYSLFTIHFSLFTFHYSLFTFHFNLILPKQIVFWPLLNFIGGLVQ